MTNQYVGSVGSFFSDSFDVVLSDFFYALEQRLPSVEPDCLQSVHRPVEAEPFSEFVEIEHVSAGARQQKDRQTRTSLRHRNDRSQFDLRVLVSKRFGQLFNRRVLEQLR